MAWLIAPPWTAFLTAGIVGCLYGLVVDSYLIPKRRRRRELDKFRAGLELAELGAILNDFANSSPIAADRTCIFCHTLQTDSRISVHTRDCVYHRARLWRLNHWSEP
jgi:hypothetical protein